MTPFDRKARRERFLVGLPERAVAVFAAAPIALRSGDSEFPYRQDSDFLYLSGFSEPESLCVLDNAGEERFVLFVQPRDPDRETWTGKRYGTDGAREHFGCDAAYTADRFDEIFGKLLADREHLYFAFGRDEATNRKILEHFRRAQAMRSRAGRSLQLASPAEILHELRLLKEPAELERMRKAAGITAVAHAEGRAAARPGAWEFEVEAAIGFAFRRLGAAGPAYPSIVASGANATTLHYTENGRQMTEGELLLVDAGAEYEHYCADVTRTYPVGPRFGAEQRRVYEIVLAAEKKAIEAVRPGVTIEEVHDVALRDLVDGLRDLGVLEGSTNEVIEKKAFAPFYMHRTSHWLGMDVHDVGSYQNGKDARGLAPGMVLTIEPGLYFRENGPDTPFRGIGVRIEDDVLVTEDGHDVLTRDIPKEIADLES